MRLRHLALPAAAGLTLLAIPFAPTAVAAAAACDDSVSTCTAVFEYTGAAQTFTVPGGVSNLAVALGGARGGDGFEGDGTPLGGPGGALTAIVPVHAGEVLTLVVGGKGGDAADDSTTPAPGGYGGGGAGSNAGSVDEPFGSVAGGGGGSFLFGSDGLLLAVGGGGGAGFTGQDPDSEDAIGGPGGAPAGGIGGPGDLTGLGASATAPGAAGGGDEVGTSGSGPATSPTALGTGGASATPCGAAGGGGGYFGGGSGGCDTTPPPVPEKTAEKAGGSYAGLGVTTNAEAEQITIYRAGGGGGGGGFVATGVSVVASSLTSDLDNGVIGLAYTSAATTTTLASAVTTIAPGQETTINATVDGPDLTIVGDEQEDSPAVTAAAKAFGAKSAVAARAAAVPTTPAPAGTTLNPGTACGDAACTVTFFVNGTQLGDPIDIDPATGVASVIFTAGSEQGVRQVTARYDGNLYYLQSSSDPLAITVAGLANTGPSNVLPMLTASAVLLVAGAGLVAFGRRRPQLGAHRAV